MGFPFSGIQKELASERFKRLYAELRSECSLLDAFPSPSSLISFFHDRNNREYGLKDSILSFLLTAYRRGGKYVCLAPFFISLFTSAIASVYSMARKIYNRIDDEEFFQDACLMLLQIIGETQIVPPRVAMQIAYKLKNRAWSLVNQTLRQARHEITEDVDRIIPLAGSGEEKDSAPAIPDAHALLDELVRRRVITKADKKMIVATVIEGKSLKDISHPKHYERLKKRRQRTLLAMKEHLANRS